MLRLLSLDGGGVRGLSSLLILREVMAAVQQKVGAEAALRPCDYFELIVGTGTGGISAVLLGRMKLTVDQAIHEYLRMADAVFRSPALLSNIIPDHPVFDGTVLEKYLRETITRHLGDPEALMFDPATSSSYQCRTAVLAATSASTDSPPYIFRTHTGSPPFKIVDATRATTATAGLFPPVSLSHPAIKFIDAGSVGYNNPTEIAISEAREIWPGQTIDLVLSIGTGSQRIVDAGSLGLAKLCQQLIDSCEAVHDRVYLSGPSSYFRFSVDRGLDSIGTTEWKEAGDQGSLAGITSAYLRKAEASRRLAACVQVIAGITGDSNYIMLVNALKPVGSAIDPKDNNRELGIKPTPDLQSIQEREAFKIILSQVELIKTNKRQMKAVAEAVARILVAFDTQAVLSDAPDSTWEDDGVMQRRRADFDKVLDRIKSFCTSMAEKNFIKSFLDASSDQDEIKTIQAQLTLSCDAFQISSQVGIQNYAQRVELARQEDQAEINGTLKQLLNNQSTLLGRIGEPDIDVFSSAYGLEEGQGDGSSERRNTVFGLLEDMRRFLKETTVSADQDAVLQKVLVELRNVSTERSRPSPSVDSNPILAHLKPGVKPEDLIRPLQTPKFRNYMWNPAITRCLTPQQQYQFDDQLDSSKLFIEYLVSCDDLPLQYAALEAFQQDKAVKHFFKKKLVYAPSDEQNPILANLKPGLQPSVLVCPSDVTNYTLQPTITLQLSQLQIGSFFCSEIEGWSLFIDYLVETDDAALQFAALEVFRKDKTLAVYFLPEPEDSE